MSSHTVDIPENILLILKIFEIDEPYDHVNCMHIIHLFKKIIELGLLFSGMSTVWEDTDGFANQYRYALDIYLMTVL